MGNFASFSLRNRAFVALTTVIVAVFGIISLGSLKLELIPNLQFPVVGVVAPAVAKVSTCRRRLKKSVAVRLAALTFVLSLYSVISILSHRI